MLDPKPEPGEIPDNFQFVEMPYPDGIYYSINDLMKTPTKTTVGLLQGEIIGIQALSTSSGMLFVETTVNGVKKNGYEEVKSDSEEPAFRSIGEQKPGFNIETCYDVPEGASVDIEEIHQGLKLSGFSCEPPVVDMQGRVRFSISLGNTEFECLYLPESINPRSKLYFEVKDNFPGPRVHPLARLYESPEQVKQAIKDAAELNSTVFSKLSAMLSPEGKAQNGHMVWRSERFLRPPWKYPISYEQYVGENLFFSDEGLNHTVDHLVKIAQQERYVGDTITPTGLDPDAQKFLTFLDAHFRKKYPQGIDDILTLNQEDRALFAIALLMESLKSGTLLDNRFYPKTNVVFADHELVLVGESYRDRLEFFRSQDRKFGYKDEQGEPAQFLLLHTRRVGEQYTLYERLQSENLLKAREWLMGQQFNVRDHEELMNIVGELNRQLLAGIVPDRCSGQLRKTEGAYIPGRIDLSVAFAIPYNLTNFLIQAELYVAACTKGQWNEDVFQELVKKWTEFDQIHPMEEGNGRTGMLLFEHWCREVFGNNVLFDSPRNENGTLSRAMSRALARTDRDLQPLVEYVRGHLHGVDMGS